MGGGTGVTANVGAGADASSPLASASNPGTFQSPYTVNDALGAYGNAGKAFNGANAAMKLASPQAAPAQIHPMPQRQAAQPNGFTQAGGFSQAAGYQPAQAAPFQIQTAPMTPSAPMGMPASQPMMSSANQLQQQLDEMRRQQMMQQGLI
jgi:hypothetical protein